jgi:hypothetical protein
MKKRAVKAKQGKPVPVSFFANTTLCNVLVNLALSRREGAALRTNQDLAPAPKLNFQRCILRKGFSPTGPAREFGK